MTKTSSWLPKVLYLVMALLLVAVMAAPALADFTNVAPEPNIATGGFTPQNVKPATTNTYTIKVTDADGFDAVQQVGTISIPKTAGNLARFLVAPGSPAVSTNGDGTFAVAGGGLDANGNYTVITVNGTATGVTVGNDTLLTITFNASAPADEGAYIWTVNMKDGLVNDGGNDTATVTVDGTAPSIPAANIVGTTIQAAGDTIAITFSEAVSAADGVWDANEISSIQSPDGTPVAFANAIFAYDVSTNKFTITLNEAAPDNAHLTNGNVVAVTPVAGKIKDLAGNLLPATKVVGTTPISGNTTAPTFSSAKFTTDTNLEITFTISDNLKAVDATKLSSTSFTVVSAALISGTPTKVNVTISVLSQTNQANGVSGAAGLQLAAGAVTDLPGNNSVAASNQTIARDLTAPTITSGTLNYGTGVLTITANEKLDTTPATNVDTSKIWVSNTAGSHNVQLTGAAVTVADATTVTITLTAAQKAAAIVISGVAGGDGGAVVVDLDAGAVKDLAGNLNDLSNGNAVTETPDTVKPTVKTPAANTLHYDTGTGTGVLVITFAETIDGNPATNVDTSKIWISNTAGSHNVQLTGAIVTAADATTVTITLTAAQKAAAIVISGVAGGDGGAVVVDLDAGAVKDLAGNLNDLSNGNAVTETADDTAPTFVSANLTSSTNIDVTFDEGMGAVAANGSEFTSAGGSWTATAAAIDATDKTVVHVTVSGIDATEELGLVGDLNITRTALADLAENPFVSVVNKNIADKIKPTFTIGYYTDPAMTTAFTGVYMSPGTYYIKITPSEALAGSPTVDISAEGTLNNDVGGATDLVGSVYRYTRSIVADPLSLGATVEVIQVTGTDTHSNTATKADVTGEKKIDAAVTTPTLSSPGTATGTSDNTPTLTWNAVTDNNGPVTYRLEVDNELNFAAPLVSEQIGLSVTTYTLTTAVVDGTYHWRVTATDALGNTNTSVIWSFVVTTDATAPSVTVNYPNGGESLLGGSSATITWAATDNVTPAALLTIDLSYSSNGGSTWTSIATGQQNDGAYTWTVPSISSSQVLVKVTATDAASISGLDTSNAVFSISVPSGPPTTSISLAAGWNLISLPLIPTNTSITSVLSGVSGSVISVWSYNASSGAWDSWNQTIGGTLTTMVDGKGYWIDMSAAGILTVTGSELPAPPAVPPTYSVVTGWNLIGFKSTTAKTVGTYLTGTNYRFPIYGYSSAGVVYQTLTLSSDSLQAGQGYWVYFNADGTISP